MRNLSIAQVIKGKKKNPVKTVVNNPNAEALDRDTIGNSLAAKSTYITGGIE